MKNIFTLLLVLATFIMTAQTVVTTLPQERNAVLEEYTGINCQYCPDGHFRANQLASDNPGRVVLINIHAGTFAVPSGLKPDFRTQWGDALVSNSQLTGYPSGTINRQVFSEFSNTISLSRNQWAAAAEKVFPQQSPVNVAFWSEIDTATRELTVNVELYYSQSSPQSTNYLNVAMLQDSVLGWQTDAGSYPGGNTNYYVHNHILRHLLTGQWGDVISTTTQGSYVTRSYTYAIPDTMPANAYATDILLEHCRIAVFVSETHNIIYTGFEAELGDTVNGATNVFTGTLNGTSPQAQLGQTGVESSNFVYVAENAMGTQEEFMFVLTTNAPADWIYSFSHNSTPYTDTAYINIDALTNTNLVLSVTPGTTPKFARFSITMTSTTFPASSAKTFDYYIMSGITDLIVNGSGAWGDGGSYDFTQKYIDGLNYAGNTSFDVIPASIMVKAANESILDNVNNLYMNIGWSFPSFTAEEATVMMAFMDNGGNVFVAGQDIGWEMSQTTTSSVVKGMYTNYFHAQYVADGSGTNNQFIPAASDHIFKPVGTSPIIDVYNGNIYPDEINAITGAKVIFQYNTTGTKKGGLRYNNGTYKLVYLGIGIEMLSDVTIANKIMKRAHDWFYGLILDAEMTLIENSDCISSNCNGSITVSQTEGQNSPSYAWSTGASSATATGLCAGTYTVTVADISDTLVLSGTLTAPAALNATTAHINATCPTCNDGVAWVIPTGESGNYTFLWNDASATTNDTLSDVLPGNYSVTITDSQCGSTYTATVVISDMIFVETTPFAVVSVYPNPASGKVHMEFPFRIPEVVELCDMTGRTLMLYTVCAHSMEIDLSAVAEGMYLLKLCNGNESATMRIQVVR